MRRPPHRVFVVEDVDALHVGSKFGIAGSGAAAPDRREPSFSRGNWDIVGTLMEPAAGHGSATSLRNRPRLLRLENTCRDLVRRGFGDLFVVRIAGNIVAPSVVGSVEFAAAQFGSRLVVVMGHTRCGAVTATVKAIETGLGPESRNIRSITDRIAPHIEGLVRPGDSEGIIREAVRANVRASVDHLRHGSRIVEELVVAGRLAVVGAEYELETGAVHFFDGVPQQTVTSPRKKDA